MQRSCFEEIMEMLVETVNDWHPDEKVGEIRTKLFARWRKELAIILNEMVAVDSTNIAAIGYERGSAVDAGTLLVTFKSGGVYSYNAVSEQLFEDFLRAPSKGKFFHARVKGNFGYKKL